MGCCYCWVSAVFVYNNYWKGLFGENIIKELIGIGAKKEVCVTLIRLGRRRLAAVNQNKPTIITVLVI